MYQKGQKVCSTPVKSDCKSLSLSISDVKPSSSDSVNQVNVIRRKRTASVIRDGKKNIRKRKYPKVKKVEENNTRRKRTVRRKRRVIESESSSEWEDVSIKDKSKQPRLFESPERVRDVGLSIEQNFVLSPPFTSQRANAFESEDEAFHKANDILPLYDDEDDDDESGRISPIFARSKLTKTYEPPKKKEWSNRLSLIDNNTENKTGDCLPNVQLPTDTANLLWDEFIKRNINELSSQSRPEENGKNISPEVYISDGSTSDTESSDILDMLDEKSRKYLKSKKLHRIKGSFNRNKKKLVVEENDIIYVSDNELPSTSDAQAKKRRRGKWIAIKEKSPFTLSFSDLDDDIKKENDKIMTFNEFNARCHAKKNEVKIRSAKHFTGTVRKKSDGNFVIVNDNPSSS